MLCLLLAAAASGKDRAAAGLMVYGDDDGVLVISPTTAGGVALGEATVDGRVTLDIISAASVDLVTAASPDGYEEVRTEVGVGGGWNFGEGLQSSATYGYSTEPDFETHSVGVAQAVDLFRRHSTLTAAYAYSRSVVGRSGDESFAELRSTHTLDGTWSQILTRYTAADLSYGLAWSRGYHANPYRYVRLYEAGAADYATALTEAAPDERLRHVATARVRTRLADALFGVLDYRFYGDSWEMRAHTVTGRLSKGLLGDALTVSVEGRGYLQSAVSFYRARYETFPEAPVLRTQAKELGPMWTALGGLHLEWSLPVGLPDSLRLGAGADVLHIRYPDFELLEGRTALIGTADLTWEP